MRLDQLFPADRIAGMADYMKRFAAQFGVEDFQTRDRIPNTRRALALAEVAREEGKLEAFRTRAMHAHWRDGLDLESDDDLTTIARDSGLAADAVRRSIDDPKYLAIVDDMREEANAIGVTGIPTFVIDNLGVTGCQPYEILAEFAAAAGAEKK